MLQDRPNRQRPILPPKSLISSEKLTQMSQLYLRLRWNGRMLLHTLIDSENFRSHNEFYAYLLIRLYHPEASEFLISLADELCSNYMNGDIDEDQIWQYMEKLNSYLMHRHGILNDPFFLNAFANEFSCDKPINKITDLVVALNQLSAGSAYRSSSDEVLFWDFVFGETVTQELFETYNDYLTKLADYVCCQNNQLLTLSSMVHPSVYLDSLTASSMISEVVLPVTCDVTGPLVVDSSLQFAPVATSPSSSVPVLSTGHLPLIDTDEMEKVDVIVPSIPKTSLELAEPPDTFREQIEFYGDFSHHPNVGEPNLGTLCYRECSICDCKINLLLFTGQLQPVHEESLIKTINSAKYLYFTKPSSSELLEELSALNHTLGCLLRELDHSNPVRRDATWMRLNDPSEHPVKSKSPIPYIEMKFPSSTLMYSHDFQSSEKFFSYMVNLLQQPSSGNFLRSRADTLVSLHTTYTSTGDLVTYELLGKSLEADNSYLRYRESYLGTLVPYESCVTTSYDTLYAIMVALNQPSSSTKERDASDQLINLKYLCDRTIWPYLCPVTLDTFNRRVDNLKKYLQQKHLKLFPCTPSATNIDATIESWLHYLCPLKKLL